MNKFDAEKTANELTSFLKLSLQGNFKSYLIGVSGGIDSATSLALAVKAVGVEHVFPVLMPYGTLSEQGTKDAWLVIDALGISHEQVHEVDIKPFVDEVAKYDEMIDPPRLGNIMARMRMVILYDLAKKYGFKHLVLGTENLTEHLLGYYTRFGDEASDVEPLRNLYKYQVSELAKYLGVPDEIITKKPTAGLWEGQTDEGELGFSYKKPDEILYLYHEEKLSKEEIMAKGFTSDEVEKVFGWIKIAEFKHQLPLKPTN